MSFEAWQERFATDAACAEKDRRAALARGLSLCALWPRARVVLHPRRRRRGSPAKLITA